MKRRGNFAPWGNRIPSRLKRSLAIVASCCLAGLIVLGGLIWLWLRYSLPSYTAGAAIPGLSADVHVFRDSYGIPHIFTQNLDDGARALGYLHAQDRLFQMEMQRRAGQGRLSEAVGPDTVSIDKFIRTLNLYALSESSFSSFSPEAKNYFQAYTDGVNAWISSHKHSLPPEFALLHITPQPWQPADSVVWGKLMALQLSHNYRLEILRAELGKKLNPKMMATLFPEVPPGSPVTLGPHSLIPTSHGQPEKDQPAKKTLSPPKDKKSGMWNSPFQNNENAADYSHRDPVEDLGIMTGLRHAASNEWVISGSRTETGSPILANDPHLGLEAPVLWYLARIVTPIFWIKGVTVPGGPLILLGQNNHIAWGFTTTNSDTEDLFIETVDPDNPANYLMPKEILVNRNEVKSFVSVPFETRTETIHVRGGSDVLLKVRQTRHGPVLSDIDTPMAALAGPGKVLALAFTGLDEQDRTSEALMGMNRAQDWPQFLRALQLYQAPTQNIVYADRDGHIGFVNAGLVPVRVTGQGDVPYEGMSGAHDWRGMIPFSQLPQLHDPAAGFIFNANNAVSPTGDGYYFYSRDWDEPYRAQRLQILFDTIPQHSLETSAQMQNDIISSAALDLLPSLLRQTPSSDAARTAYSLLKNWDGSMDAGRPEPLIFEAWLYQLHKKILLEKVNLSGAQMEDKGPYSASVLATILNSNDPEWCGKGGCDSLVTSAFDEAIAMLEAQDGQKMSAWRWGKEHRSVIINKVFSHIPFLSWVSDLSVSSSGGYYTLDRGESAEVDPAEPFLKRQGSGYRGIYDLAHPDKSLFMIATGESGHFLGKHYGDLLPLWNKGQYVTLDGTEADLESRGAKEMVLSPAAP